MGNLQPLTLADPEVFDLVRREAERLEATIDLIAAENHPPQAILEARGSVFENKTAEGYPGMRYHAGCGHVDALERLAIRRACRLFGAEHANVQPLSGVSANLAVYFAVLEVGERVLAMRLAHGGHLSHGDAASVTSRCFQFRHYGLDPATGRIDYDAVGELAEKLRPRLIVAGASSYPRLIDYARLAAIAGRVSAYLLVDMAHIAGLVAAGVIPSPVAFCDFATFTTYKTMAGARGGCILCRAEHASRVDRAVFPGGQGTSSMGAVAAKAVCFGRAMRPEFRTYQQRVLANAAGLAENLAARGYRIVSGGTENHMVLVDLRAKGITGDRAEAVLESVGIIVNRNVIPDEAEKPGKTSGIRLGSAAISSRGMEGESIELLADLIDRALTHSADTAEMQRVAGAVAALCRRYPVYRRT